MTALTLTTLEARIRGLAAPERAELVAKVKPLLNKCWLPQGGPQSEAFFSEADELLYGGAAGGGKTDLLLGLASTQHQRSTVFRRQSNDLDTLWERLTEIVQKVGVTQSNSNKKTMTLNDGRRVYGAHLDAPGSEKSHQGNARDFYGFDEAAQMDEFKIAFVTQWLRSTDPSQRKRIVFATNPPMPEMRDGQLQDVAVGDWLIRWFAPWLDDTFTNPAEVGELRWCFMRREGDRLTTVWVDGPGYYDMESAAHIPEPTQDDIDAGRYASARSRTFIRSLAKDNAFLAGTGYVERLAGQPEPFRSMLLTGDFSIKGEDHPMQVIPTEWVVAAQARWRKREPERRRLKQLVLAGDVAQGGADMTVLAPLLETDFFDELTVRPGRDTPTGLEVMAMILTARKHGSLIVLDGTGSWGASTALLLEKDHKITPEMCVASHGSSSWNSTMTYRYANVRAEMWWTFREALDPQSEFEICLPPSIRLRTQLSAPLWGPKGKLLYIESKDEIRSRIGASTDEADAVLMAWLYRDMALALRMNGTGKKKSWLAETLTGNQAGPGDAMDFDDPLGNW